MSACTHTSVHMHECIDSLGECCASDSTCSDSSTISLHARDADVNALRVGLVQDLVQDQTREEPQGTVCAISISSGPHCTRTLSSDICRIIVQLSRYLADRGLRRDIAWKSRQRKVIVHGSFVECASQLILGLTIVSWDCGFLKAALITSQQEDKGHDRIAP